jgi:hypothetical protein
VEPLFDLASPATAPFRAIASAVVDNTSLTGLRVNLPQPEFSLCPWDCGDGVVLNTVDGFNVQPRLRIPFSGPIQGPLRRLANFLQ